MKYKVNEIFKSIQGEGANLGLECCFIRLAGCNLNCAWCDTNHTTQFIYDENEITNQVDCRNVIITGGEPTIQDLNPLLKTLKSRGVWIGIETNGINNIEPYLEFLNYVAVSPKNHNLHKSFIGHIDEIRIVNDNIDTSSISYFERFNPRRKFISVLEKDSEFNLLETVKFIGKINEGRKDKWILNQQMHKMLKIK